jgi:cyclopropane-fatty-acyl-phospholipid synthase
MSSLMTVVTLSIAAMLLAWNWQKNHVNAGIVDVVWAYGMMFAGVFYAFTGAGPLLIKLSLGVLTFSWFMRLGIYLQRRVLAESEDGRYQAMRRSMKEHATLGFLLFFILQAGFIVLLSLPFWVVAQNMQPQPALVAAALILAALSLYGETTADQQLATFKSNPEHHGVTCRQGWWRYSRHPNYYFEWLHWFAYPLLGWGSSYQYELWLAPIVMFCFLYFLTGIPFTEQQALRSRGEDYRKYQQTTSKFILWWPKSKSD